MTGQPTLCVIFNNVDERSSIGSLCARSVRTALDAGWRVSVVARDLDPALRAEVEWLPMYVPPRLHAVQWYSALPAVRRAIGGRRWDVVHVQQPQLAPIAHLLHLHYLVRAARQATPVQPGAGWRQSAGRAQARIIEWGESRRLARLPERLELAPVSTFLAGEFVRLYGSRRGVTVLNSPAPPVSEPIGAPERAAARRALVGDRAGLVVGFLGGEDPRKGGARLLDGVAGVDGVTVLAGGHGLPRHRLAADPSRVVGLGFVQDLRQFYAACDVFAAVSSFDPGPLTALEAAAHGVPVLGSSGCGVVRDLAAAGAAVLWEDGDLASALRLATGDVEGIRGRAAAFLQARSRARWDVELLGLYDRLAARSAPDSLRHAG